MLLKYLKRLYSLDTLDTRFNRSSTKPLAPNAANKPTYRDPARPPLNKLDYQSSEANGVRQSEICPGSPIARWWSLEFMVYGISISAAVFMMIKKAYEVSMRKRSIQPVAHTIRNQY